MKCVKVATRIFLKELLLYQDYDKSNIGDVVKVEVGKKTVLGIVIENQITVTSPSFTIKTVSEIVINKLFSREFIKFIQHFAEYNISPLTNIIPICLPSGINKHQAQNCQNAKENGITLYSLNAQQQETYNKLIKDFYKYSVDLIYGVTGSGKTEVFLHLINYILSSDDTAQILLMLPEVMMAETFLHKFSSRISYKHQIWHSGRHKRQGELQSIMNGSTKIVIGTRSALMLPYKNLRCIIIDEEHDDSYVQKEKIYYNARDMAILRGFYENFPIYLFSATPSISSFYNASQGKYFLHTMQKKFFNTKAPSVAIISRNRKNILSENSLELLNYNIKNDFQTIILINKRGYAKGIRCDKCNHEPKCENCDALLSYHKKHNILKCHYCNYKETFDIMCTKCSTKRIFVENFGIEKFAEFIQKTLKSAKIEIVSSDITNSTTKMKQTIENILNENVNVIVGTRMISKGLHFPKVRSVIIIDENLTNVDHYDANEKLMQIVFQVIGRAGREMENESNIIIESNAIDSKMIEFINTNKYLDFLDHEIKCRNSIHKTFRLPPFVRDIHFIIETSTKEKLMQIQNNLQYEIQNFINNHKKEFDTIKLFGPLEYHIGYIKKQYRSYFVLRFDKNKNICKAISSFIYKTEFSDVRVIGV